MTLKGLTDLMDFQDGFYRDLHRFNRFLTHNSPVIRNWP